MIAVDVLVSESLSQEKAPMVDFEGTDATDKVEVIDLDDYVFRFCTCSVESVTNPSPPPRVLLASSSIVLVLPIVSSCKRRAEAKVESPALLMLQRMQRKRHRGVTPPIAIIGFAKLN